MEQNFDTRALLQGTFDFGTCQRADGSYYGHGGQKCHKGSETTLPSKLAQSGFMKKLSPENQNKIGSAVEVFRMSVRSQGYSSDGVQMWDKAIESQFGELNDRMEPRVDKKTGETKPPSYDEAKAVAQAVRMWDPNEGRVATEMLGKAPTKLDIDGVRVDPSLNMVPEVRSAQIGWRDPITNTKYKTAELDAATGELVAPKNNAGRGESSMVITGSGKAMLDYKGKLESEGKSWPPDNSQTQVNQAEAKKLSQDNPNLWRSGLNTQDKGKERSEAFDVYDIENKNPSAEVKALRQAKNDAVAEAYLKYDGKSALTGKDVPLPVGGNHVTVDHVVPLSSFAAPGRSKLQESAAANVATNFHIVERDLNQTKSDGNHKSLASSVEKTMDGGFTKKMTDNWGNSGSKITLSEPEFNARFPKASGQFSSASDRQKFASAYEQRRIANISGGEAKSTVPTTSRKRGGPDPKRAFTPPSGTINTTAATPSRPAVARSTRSTPTTPRTPTPRRTNSGGTKNKAPQPATTPKKAPTAQQRADYIKDRQDALRKAKKEKRSGDVARLEATLKALGA